MVNDVSLNYAKVDVDMQWKFNAFYSACFRHRVLVRLHLHLDFDQLWKRLGLRTRKPLHPPSRQVQRGQRHGTTSRATATAKPTPLRETTHRSGSLPEWFA